MMSGFLLGLTGVDRQLLDSTREKVKYERMGGEAERAALQRDLDLGYAREHAHHAAEVARREAAVAFLDRVVAEESAAGLAERHREHRRAARSRALLATLGLVGAVVVLAL